VLIFERSRTDFIVEANIASGDAPACGLFELR